MMAPLWFSKDVDQLFFGRIVSKLLKYRVSENLPFGDGL